MPLSKKQKKLIDDNKDKFNPAQLSKKFDLNIDEVNNYLDTKIPAVKKNYPKWFWAFPVLIPIVFFVLLEILLKIFSYGSDVKEWINISPDYEILNPEISKRYFSKSETIPFSIESFLKKEKPDNSFRVIILGESSAAGYPYMISGSFSKYIRKALELAYPQKQIEVANLSMAAISTFTIRDITSGLIEKKPDLILIYTGHNEFYGALGVGSMESIGKSRFIVNTYLWLSKFKTFELIKNILDLFSNGADNTVTGRDATLMAQMASNKLIVLNSSTFEAGIKQFEGNMSDIISEFKSAGIPVILSTVASNLKDQFPFVSDDNVKPTAKEIFTAAQTELKNKNYRKADSFIKYARDLDALRFRAPSKLNETIIQLGKEFDCPVVDAENFLNLNSTDGISGNDLMTDHVHPNVKGYQLIGKLFFDSIIKNKFVEGTPDLSTETIDSIVNENYFFTEYDSTSAAFRIKILKSDWPFVSKGNKTPPEKLIIRKNFVDTVAFDMIRGKISRENARRVLMKFYYSQKKYDKFFTEFMALTEEFPFRFNYYRDAASDLIKAGQLRYAYLILEKNYKVHPDFFSAKWLGIINLSRKNIDGAISFLEKSISFNPSDAQVYYNLTGAYADKKEFRKALDAINKCIQIEPEFPNAKHLQNQLFNVLNIRN